MNWAVLFFAVASTPVHAMGNTSIIDQPPPVSFYGIPDSYVSCVVVLNSLGLKTDALKFGAAGKKMQNSSQKRDMFDEIGFVDFNDFSSKMTIDEAKEILYYSVEASDIEVLTVANRCKDAIYEIR